MNKYRIHWKTQEHTIEGNALGYNTHNAFMRKYSQDYFEFDESSNVCLQIAPADHYEPVKGKYNILFTMWEATEIPSNYVSALNRADLIVVPSRFCKDLFRKYTRKPIEVCFEGVEAEKFPYYERMFPLYGKPFRFFWCGASNPRKGYLSILQMVKMIEQTPNCELYIKTTVQKFDRKAYLTNIWKKRQFIRQSVKDGVLGKDQSVASMLKRARIRRTQKLENNIQRKGKYQNIIFDTRKLPFDELVDLYNSAHCFLLPTLGEGWGLTLCEAMATGCPSIATAVTGCADFFDESVGYPIQYTEKEHYLSNYEVRAGSYFPETEHLARLMMYVYHNYSSALRKGKKASDRIHSKFTWDRSASRLFDIVSKYVPQKERELVYAN